MEVKAEICQRGDGFHGYRRWLAVFIKCENHKCIGVEGSVIPFDYERVSCVKDHLPAKLRRPHCIEPELSFNR
jgi:hypothetical protein